MADVTREQIDAALAKREGYLKASPEQRASYRAQAYAEFGLGEPAAPSMVQRGIRAASSATGIPEGVLQFGAAAPIPALTTAMGATAGSILPGPGTLIGGMIGGGAGEAINQKLGITEPSEAAVALNTAAPLVGRYLQPAYQGLKSGVARFLPGAGQALQERAALLAPTVSQLVAPKTSSEALYTQLEAHNPHINAAPFRDSLVQMQEEVAQRLGDSAEKTRLLKYLQSKIQAVDRFPQGEVPFQSMRATQKELNAKIGSKEGGEELGILKQLAKGIKTSFDQTVEAGGARPDAVGLLKQANQAFIKEQGQAELDKAFTKSLIEDVGGVQTFSDQARKNIKKILNTNPDIQAAYSSSEISQMKQALDAIGPLPGLPPKPDTLYGGLRYSGPAVLGGILAGPVAGVHPIVGATAGMTVDLLLRKVVSSDRGRQLVIDWATQHGRKVPPEVVMSIASALTAGGGGVMNPAEAQGAEAIRPPQSAVQQPMPPQFESWLSTRSPASQRAIRQNMKSMMPDEQRAYATSLTHP